MLERKFIDPDEESHGGSVCLPCFNRNYTSDCSHWTVLAFLTATGGSLFSAAALLFVSQYANNQAALKASAWLGGTSLVSAISTGVSFFCGTKSKEVREVNEKDCLVQVPENHIATI